MKRWLFFFLCDDECTHITLSGNVSWNNKQSGAERIPHFPPFWQNMLQCQKSWMTDEKKDKVTQSVDA